MGNLGGEASAAVDAPIDEVYALLEDVAIAPEWQSGLQEMTVLESDAQGRPLRCITSSDAKVRVIRTEVRFSYEPNTAVRWEQTKGDLKSLVGAWELRDLGDGRTQVTYRLTGDPGRMLGMMVRGPVEGRIREKMVDVRPGEVAARLAKG
ncbi:MAG: cyclase/dehydrase [Solirubrobacterales bacterium]|nr:cyclase/dehydrase [Solirubrobacterales bacterium]